LRALEHVTKNPEAKVRGEFSGKSRLGRGSECTANELEKRGCCPNDGDAKECFAAVRA
jgi:hypothetical protein